MSLYIELDGRGPRYEQLARGLKEAILGGLLAEGARLPPTRMFATELGLSRNTVVTAYELLCTERLAVSVTGSGTFVAGTTGAAIAPATRSLPARQPALPPQARYAARLRGLPRLALPFGPARPRFDLQYGEPFVDPPLISAWQRELAHAAAGSPWAYPPSAGLASLRQGIAEYLARRRGVICHPDDIVVVNGAQQAVSLLARVLLDEGDAVAVEDPGYQLAIQSLLAHGARIVPVPVDEDGLRVPDLADEEVRLVHVTPSHQFPSGVVMSLERRRALLDHAGRRCCWVLEDDYDGEFRYDAAAIPALRSLDGDGRVIYVGSFSKVLFPGLRLGYVVCPPALRGDLVLAKRCEDIGCSAVEQAALAALMSVGAFDRHLRRAALELRRRRAALLEGLRRHCSAWLRWQDSRAGMHVVAWLDGWSAEDVQALVELARGRGVGLYPIGPHYLRRPAPSGLLLGYAALSAKQLEAAAQLLGRCLAGTARR